jgi:hypothetical protein
MSATETANLIATARLAKSRKMADLLLEHGWSIGEVRALSADGWKEVAKIAGTRPPSGPETIATIIEMMEGKHATAATH